MKSLLCSGLWTVSSVAPVPAEEVTVFACDDSLVDIPRSAVITDIETDERELTLLVYKPGQNMGLLNTGDTDLATISKTALAEDQSQSPPFGPGYEFILRDSKGRNYIAFLEYEKGHKTFSGFRAALAPLNDLGSKGGVFVGVPHLGMTFDKALLKQLKAFADKVSDEAKGEDEKTKKESE